MQKKPLVSVIIPVYNVEKYIHECMESVLAQSYRVIEIFVIIDGSQDRSESIVREYMAIDERVNILSRKNEGLLSTRIDGIKMCKGEYLMFIDSDDWVDVNIVGLLVSTACETGADIVRCGIMKEDIGKDKRWVLENPFHHNQLIKHRQFNDMIYPLFVDKLILNNVWGQLIKKEILNIPYIDSLIRNINFAEDLYINLAIYKTVHSVYFLNEPLYHYRHNSEGLSHKNDFISTSKKLSDLLVAHSKLFDAIKYWDIDTEDNRQSVGLRILKEICNQLHSACACRDADNNQKRELIKKIINDKQFVYASSMVDVNFLKKCMFNKRRLLLALYNKKVNSILWFGKLYNVVIRGKNWLAK